MPDYQSEYRAFGAQQEVTLQKISNLEDDYSKMKRALLSSMEEDEDELSPEKLSEVEGPPAARINSRSFLDESSPSNRDLSRTHGKASTVDAEFVEFEHKLGANPSSSIKHEEMLARRSAGVYTIPEEEEDSRARGRRLMRMRRCACA
jgi:hypothetical protein